MRQEMACRPFLPWAPGKAALQTQVAGEGPGRTNVSLRWLPAILWQGGGRGSGVGGPAHAPRLGGGGGSGNVTER